MIGSAPVPRTFVFAVLSVFFVALWQPATALVSSRSTFRFKTGDDGEDDVGVDDEDDSGYEEASSICPYVGCAAANAHFFEHLVRGDKSKWPAIVERCARSPILPWAKDTDRRLLWHPWVGAPDESSVRNVAKTFLPATSETAEGSESSQSASDETDDESFGSGVEAKSPSILLGAKSVERPANLDNSAFTGERRLSMYSDVPEDLLLDLEGAELLQDSAEYSRPAELEQHKMEDAEADLYTDVDADLNDADLDDADATMEAHEVEEGDEAETNEEGTKAGTPKKSDMNRHAKKTKEDEKNDQTPLPILDDAAKAETRSLLTTGQCQPAYGSQLPPVHTCEFKNLYVQQAARRGKPLQVLVAHVLDEGFIDSSVLIRTGIFVRGKPAKPLNEVVQIVKHASVEHFGKFLSDNAVTDQPGNHIAFLPLWHFNIGHALYDSLYPMFVSLIQWNRHTSNWRSMIWGEHSGKVEHIIPGAYNHTEDIYGAIGGNGLMRLEGGDNSDAGIERLEVAVLGQGFNGQKMDANADFRLGAGRELQAAALFRQKVYDTFGVTPRAHTPGRRIKAVIIENKRFVDDKGDAPPKFASDLIALTAKHGIDLEYFRWGAPVESFNGTLLSDASPAVQKFQRHIDLFSKVDIHISAPGTAQMFQQFLPDGAVHINLGEVDRAMKVLIPRYMEEWMAEGAPYIKALYYWPYLADDETGGLQRKRRAVGETQIDVARLNSMIAQASTIAQGKFEPVSPGKNLSPIGTIMRAYYHLTEDPELIAQKTPLRLIKPDIGKNSSHLHIAGCLGNHFIHDTFVVAPRTSLESRGGDDPSARCFPNQCLIRSLMEAYGPPCKKCAWVNMHA